MKETIVDTLIWGTVSTNGKKYFLLEPTPAPSLPWMWKSNSGLIRWLVAEENDYSFLVNDEHTVTYNASYIFFGSNAVVELLQNPTVTKSVRYFLPDAE